LGLFAEDMAEMMSEAYRTNATLRSVKIGFSRLMLSFFF